MRRIAATAATESTEVNTFKQIALAVAPSEAQPPTPFIPSLFDSPINSSRTTRPTLDLPDTAGLPPPSTYPIGTTRILTSDAINGPGRTFALVFTINLQMQLGFV